MQTFPSGFSRVWPRVWPGLFIGLWFSATWLLWFNLPCYLIILVCRPALILSPNSDFDSALSTLCLKLVIEFCLFDLHSVLIKLHMDPNATDSSLLKTSPAFDPAAFYHFTTEVSAQASALATHQQQLNRLTSVHHRQPSSRLPEKFDRSPTKCEGFLLQCSMFVNQQPMLYRLTRAASIRVFASHGESTGLGHAVWSEVRPTFLRSGRLFNVSRRCLSTPLEERRWGSNYCLSVKEGVRRPTTLSHFALSQFRRGARWSPQT